MKLFRLAAMILCLMPALAMAADKNPDAVAVIIGNKTDTHCY